MALTLTSIESAIEALLTGGQSVMLDGMMFTQANLGDLIRMRDKFKRESERATRPTVRAVNMNGMGY